MSLPAIAAGSATAAQAIAALNPLDAVMASVNSNPYFIGLMMLSLNLGGRFLGLEISKEQEKFLSQPMVRRFFLFAVLFVATRNIVIAAGLTIIVIVLLGYLFNENSALCLWKYCLPVAPGADGQGQETEQKEGFTGKGLSPDEQQMLRRLLDKQRAAEEEVRGEGNEGKEGKEKEKTSGYLISTYQQNMSALAGSRAGGKL